MYVYISYPHLFTKIHININPLPENSFSMSHKHLSVNRNKTGLNISLFEPDSLSVFPITDAGTASHPVTEIKTKEAFWLLHNQDMPTLYLQYF